MASRRGRQAPYGRRAATSRRTPRACRRRPDGPTPTFTLVPGETSTFLFMKAVAPGPRSLKTGLILQSLDRRAPPDLDPILLLSLVTGTPRRTQASRQPM